MPIAVYKQDQVQVVGKALDPGTGEDRERRETFMAALPMLIVFVLWLFMQVWLMGPLLFR